MRQTTRTVAAAQRAWPLLVLLAGLGLPCANSHAQAPAPAPGAAAPAPAPAPTTVPEPVLRTGCPLIRPSGLSPDQVDALVLAQVAMALQRPVAQLRLDKSLAEQNSVAGEPVVSRATDDSGLRFAYLALALGEALGFDATERFSRTAQALGAASAASGVSGVSGAAQHGAALPISTLQAVSRGAYQAGSDGPPPRADAAARYQLDGLNVGAPADTDGWYLLRCGHDQVAYWRRGVVDGESATAVARITSMPPWTGADAFVAYMRQLLLATVPAGYSVRQVQVTPTGDSDRPCAEAVLLARQADAPYRMKARFCYASTQGTLGHALLFSHAGSDDLPRFNREADGFFANVRSR